MFYHYNTITIEEGPVLTESFKEDFDNDNRSYNSTIVQSARKNYDLMLSGKFQQVKDYDRTICDVVFPRKSTIRLFLLIISFIGFLYFGAWTFQMLEHKNEILNREQFKEARIEFLKEHQCVNDSSLEEFIIKIENLKDKGLSAHANASEENWDIPTGVFFVTTLVTTIGYGNDKPLTNWGKIFCIIFIIIGLPMMMIIATAVIERLFIFTDLTFSKLCYIRKWTITEDKFREIEMIICILILLGAFICIPAWAFVTMEEQRWSYLEAIYYCVISLTTIGLGDFVPGESTDKYHRNLMKILSTVYLFIGLLWASFCIQIFHRYHRWNVGAKFVYLESDDLNMRYGHLNSVSTELSLHDSPEAPDVRLYTNLEPIHQVCPNNGRKSRFKSVS